MHVCLQLYVAGRAVRMCIFVSRYVCNNLKYLKSDLHLLAVGSRDLRCYRNACTTKPSL